MSVKKGHIRKEYNLPEDIVNKIEELANEAGVTNTEAVINAILFKYNADVMDEHSVLGRMSQLQKKMDYIDKKLETFSSLIYYIIPYFLAVHPDLPKDKNESTNQLNKGSQKMMNLVMNFRKWLKTEKISFVQSVFGDSQETLEQTYTEESVGLRELNG